MRWRWLVRPRKLGLVSGSAGMVRLFPGLVRIPDVAFASWQRLPEGRVPDDPIPPGFTLAVRDLFAELDQHA